MSDKLVWSNNKTLDYLLGLSEEDLRAEIADLGYRDDFVSGMSLEELHRLLEEDDALWQLDVEEFETDIEPMINKQTADGIVLMDGEAARWNGNYGAGKAVFTEELIGGNIHPDIYDIDIVDDGEGLVWLGHHHDGTHRFKLYALPEENQVDFIRNCMEDAIEDEYHWYHDGEDFADVEDDILEAILGNITNPEYLTENINFGQVPNYCKPIKNLLNESLGEEKIEEASSKEPKKLAKELKEIKKLAADYGKEYFTSMPFTSFDNDPTSIEYNYPEFFRIAKAFFKEMELVSKEELENTDLLDELWDTNISQHDWDTIVKTCEKLVAKGKGGTEQIEKIYKTGYNSPLDDAEILASREAPEFDESLDLTEKFSDIRDFSLEELKSMEGKNVVFNKDIVYSNLDQYSEEDEKPNFDKLGFIIKENGNVVIPKGYIATIKGISSYEGYNPELYLESNGEGFEIALGWVERNEMSIVESLNEARYDLLDKKGYPIGSYTDKDKAMKAAKEKEDELGSVVIHDKDSVKKYDKKYTGWSKQNESLNEKFEPNSTFHFDSSIDWDDFYDEDFIERMEEHDGKPCHASLTVWVDGKEDPASNYFTVTFEDGFELKDLSGYHLDLDEVEIEESLNEDSDYIVVRGVKVPKEYFEKYPGLTNFEVRDKFLADEEEESPYMHADDIDFDEALTEGVKIPKTWLVTDKLDQQFKVRNGNHFYTEEDVKDYYPDVTKVEVAEYFTEDELNEKPWMVDNFNDHKKLKESWNYAIDYANYAWDNPRVDIIKMLKDDGKDKKFINDVLDLLDEFAAEDELNRLNY